MTNVEIFFRDLMPATQAEILEAVGIKSEKEMNWDVFPIDVWEFTKIDEEEK